MAKKPAKNASKDGAKANAKKGSNSKGKSASAKDARPVDDVPVGAPDDAPDDARDDAPDDARKSAATAEPENQNDLEALLAALPGDDPCGIPISDMPVFREIQEARRSDNADLPQGIWQTELKQADWIKVRDLCQTTLVETSKDLHCAIWLTEAWTQMEGMAGFRRGLDLTASLCEEYWEGLHPRLEPDDADFRIAPLLWAARHLPVLLRLMPITRPVSGEARAFTVVDWQEVLRLENLAKRDAESARRAGRNKPDRTAFEASVSLTPLAFHETMAEETEGALAELNRLDAFLDTAAPDDAPSFVELKSVLDEIDERLRLYIESRGGRLPGSEAAPSQSETGDDKDTGQEKGDAVVTQDDPNGAASDSVASNPVAANPGASGPIRGRAEAYQRLSEVADYLIRTEPHSPVPYLIRRAVSWGDMSFGELLVQLVEGGGDHTRVLRLLGLNEMGKPEQPKK